MRPLLLACILLLTACGKPRGGELTWQEEVVIEASGDGVRVPTSTGDIEAPAGTKVRLRRGANARQPDSPNESATLSYPGGAMVSGTAATPSVTLGHLWFLPWVGVLMVLGGIALIGYRMYNPALKGVIKPWYAAIPILAGFCFMGAPYVIEVGGPVFVAMIAVGGVIAAALIAFLILRRAGVFAKTTDRLIIGAEHAKATIAKTPEERKAINNAMAAKHGDSDQSLIAERKRAMGMK